MAFIIIIIPTQPNFTLIFLNLTTQVIPAWPGLKQLIISSRYVPIHVQKFKIIKSNIGESTPDQTSERWAKHF